MTTEKACHKPFHLGRTWWMTVLTICVNAILGILAINNEVEAKDIIAPIVGVTAAAATHNIGRAYEDAAKNKNGANGPPL